MRLMPPLLMLPVEVVAQSAACSRAFHGWPAVVVVRRGTAAGAEETAAERSRRPYAPERLNCAKIATGEMAQVKTIDGL